MTSIYGLEYPGLEEANSTQLPAIHIGDEDHQRVERRQPLQSRTVCPSFLVEKAFPCRDCSEYDLCDNSPDNLEVDASNALHSKR